MNVIFLMIFIFNLMFHNENKELIFFVNDNKVRNFIASMIYVKRYLNLILTSIENLE
jgi:ABC-type uncharacterized transport system involved in gliding motility auxiliary subunit